MGKAVSINPTGTFRPKFKQNFSGFVTHKDRYKEAQFDPSILHFAPENKTPKIYYNPMPDKFAGYAQYPYKLNKDFPAYLAKPGSSNSNQKKKATSVILGK